MPWPTTSVRIVWRIDRPRPHFRPLTPSYPQGVVTPQKTWSAKRERQYEHIKESLLQRGESMEASPSSINDMSSGRRGGLRSHKGPGGRTLLQLCNEASMLETPPVAASKARAVAPLLVSGIDLIARSRLLTVSVDALLVRVASLLSGARISVVVVCDGAGAAAYNHPMNALAMRKTLGL